MLSQDQRQIRHALARVALAKAIKTPDENEPEAEHWTKSIIFNQPFLKQLQKQQQQQKHPQHQYPQQKQYPPQIKHRDKGLDNKLKPQDINKNRSSLVIEKKMSELSIKKHGADAAAANRVYLPSDSEEDDDVDDDDDTEEDDDNSEDGSEVIKVQNQQRPTSIPLKPRQNSIDSTRDDISTPSRGSNSSHTLPLTDDDEAPSPIQQHRIRNNNATPPIKDEYIYHRSPQSKQTINSNNRPMSMDMMDPVHYQRMQMYQTQLQYQQQIQYQQAMALQQQQNVYLLSQNPSVFFPPGARHMEDSNSSPPRNKRHSTDQISPRIRNSKQHNMNSTDARRRAEMMKNSTDAVNKRPPSQYYSHPFHTPMIKTNNYPRSSSRNI